jgi:hypothetical protein
MPRPGGGTVKVAVKAVKSNLSDADRIIPAVDRDDTPPQVVAAEVGSPPAAEVGSQGPPAVTSSGPSRDPIEGDEDEPPPPPTEEPIVIDAAPKEPPTALSSFEQRKERRVALEAEVARKEKERTEFYESRGATDIEPTKTGKSSRWYAPLGWNDRPSLAAQPVSEDDLEQGNIIVPKVQAPFKSPTPVSAIDERARYGLSKQDMSPFTSEADEMEISRGKMFVGGAPSIYREDPSARLEAGIANIRRKVDKANTERNATQAKITEREHAMKLIDEIMPRKPDGSISNVGNVRPLSDEAKLVLQDYADHVPGEEHSRINYAALMEDYDNMKAEADALRPELRRSKLRTEHLAMALSKYQDIYTNLPTDRSGS